MEGETFARLLDSLRELPHLQTVHFGGFGEPLNHPGISEMLKVVKGLGLKTEIITNGSLLSEKFIKEQINLELNVHYVSLDGPDGEEHNQIRQGANFNQVFNNTLNLNRIKKEFGVDHTGASYTIVKRK